MQLQLRPCTLPLTKAPRLSLSVALQMLQKQASNTSSTGCPWVPSSHLCKAAALAAYGCLATSHSASCPKRCWMLEGAQHTSCTSLTQQVVHAPSSRMKHQAGLLRVTGSESVMLAN